METAIQNQKSDLQRHSKTGSMVELVERAKEMVPVYNDEIENIKQVLRWCFAFIGVRPENLPDEAGKMVLLDYMKTNIKNYSILDIKNAFTLYVQGKLDYHDPHFQNFSVLFLENVLQSYRRYVVNLPKQNLYKPNPEPSQAERERIMIEACKREFEIVKGGNIAFDFGNCVYDYLSKKGHIRFTNERKEKFMQMAKSRLMSDAYKKQNGTKVQDAIRAIESNKGNNIVVEAKKLALTEYFKQMIEMEIDINEII